MGTCSISVALTSVCWSLLKLEEMVAEYNMEELTTLKDEICQARINPRKRR